MKIAHYAFGYLLMGIGSTMWDLPFWQWTGFCLCLFGYDIIFHRVST